VYESGKQIKKVDAEERMKAARWCQYGVEYLAESMEVANDNDHSHSKCKRFVFSTRQS
jgi:hypothetical protein